MDYNALERMSRRLRELVGHSDVVLDIKVRAGIGTAGVLLEAVQLGEDFAHSEDGANNHKHRT